MRSARRGFSRQQAARFDARPRGTLHSLIRRNGQMRHWPPMQASSNSSGRGCGEGGSSNRVSATEGIPNTGETPCFDTFPLLRQRSSSSAPALFQTIALPAAEILSQRGADLKKLADAWEPLYKTLTADQKIEDGFRDVRGHAWDTRCD